MQIHIDLNDEDYITYNIFHAFYSQKGQRSMALGRCMLLILAGLSVVLLTLGHVQTLLIAVDAGILLIASVFWYLYYPNIVKKRIRKKYMTLKNSGRIFYHPGADVEFTENEIIETTSDSQNRVPYTMIMDIWVGEDAYYLMQSAVQALIVPYRCLENREAFFEYVKERCLHARRQAAVTPAE